MQKRIAAQLFTILVVFAALLQAQSHDQDQKNERCDKQFMLTPYGSGETVRICDDGNEFLTPAQALDNDLRKIAHLTVLADQMVDRTHPDVEARKRGLLFGIVHSINKKARRLCGENGKNFCKGAVPFSWTELSISPPESFRGDTEKIHQYLLMVNSLCQKAHEVLANSKIYEPQRLKNLLFGAEKYSADMLAFAKN